MRALVLALPIVITGGAASAEGITHFFDHVLPLLGSGPAISTFQGYLPCDGGPSHGCSVSGVTGNSCHFVIQGPMTEVECRAKERTAKTQCSGGFCR
jgi:hypothetical protein